MSSPVEDRSLSASSPAGPSRSDSTIEETTLSKLDLHHLPDDKPVFVCQKCSQVVALQDELMSKAFNGRNGRAYLMNSTINTHLGKREDRKLLTGLHTVADLLCSTCDTSLGWVYIKAPNGEQQYKEGESDHIEARMLYFAVTPFEGRFILESAKIVKENGWTLD